MPACRCPVINGGVSGDTAAGGLARLDWVAGRRSRRRHRRTRRQRRAARPRSRGDQSQSRCDPDPVCKQQHRAILLAGMLAPPNLGDEYAASFNAIFPDLAKQHDVTLLSLLPRWRGRQSLARAAGRHPSDRRRVWPSSSSASCRPLHEAIDRARHGLTQLPHAEPVAACGRTGSHSTSQRAEYRYQRRPAPARMRQILRSPRRIPSAKVESQFVQGRPPCVLFVALALPEIRTLAIAPALRRSARGALGRAGELPHHLALHRRGGRRRVPRHRCEPRRHPGAAASTSACPASAISAAASKLRSLWVGVDKQPALFHLRDKIESAVVRAGLPPDGQKYQPHVTLARSKGEATPKLGEYLVHNNLFRSAALRGDAFHPVLQLPQP